MSPVGFTDERVLLTLTPNIAIFGNFLTQAREHGMLLNFLSAQSGLPKKELRGPMRPRPRFYGLILCFGVLLAFAIVFGNTFLLAMNPSFGGGHVRHAILVMDRGALDNQTARALLPPADWNASGKVQTKLLEVIFADPTQIVLGDVPDLPRQVLEIPRTEITSIIWMDESALFKTGT